MLLHVNVIFCSSLVLILTLMGYCGQCFNASGCKESLWFQHDACCMEFAVSVWRISLSKLIQLDWILLSSLLSCLNFLLVFSMMRKRVDARRVPTLRDVHPHEMEFMSQSIPQIPHWTNWLWEEETKLGRVGHRGKARDIFFSYND